MSALNEALIAERYDGVHREAAVNAACKAVLLAAGVRRKGQMVEVLKGRHKGLSRPVAAIEWSEAEVRLEGCARWFSIWCDRGYIRVVS